uniref:Uncharacterized protein n=1 Tax=Rhizophora mucronata TaxID=61149 RepID=A0A2P2KH47_RHIMU
MQQNVCLYVVQKLAVDIDACAYVCFNLSVVYGICKCFKWSKTKRNILLLHLLLCYCVYSDNVKMTPYYLHRTYDCIVVQSQHDNLEFLTLVPLSFFLFIVGKRRARDVALNEI